MANMQNDDDARREFARSIMRDLAATGNGSMLVEAADGSKPVIFALDHELMSAVMSRAKLAGERVNLFVALKGGRAAFGALETTATSVAAHDGETLGPDPLHEDVQIGMFMEFVLEKAEPVRFSVRLRKTSAEVSDVRELASTPA